MAGGFRTLTLDISSANQALSLEYSLVMRAELMREMYRIPEDIDRELAALKLEGNWPCC